MKIRLSLTEPCIYIVWFISCLTFHLCSRRPSFIVLSPLHQDLSDGWKCMLYVDTQCVIVYLCVRGVSSMSVARCSGCFFHLQYSRQDPLSGSVLLVRPGSFFGVRAKVTTVYFIVCLLRCKQYSLHFKSRSRHHFFPHLVYILHWIWLWTLHGAAKTL